MMRRPKRRRRLREPRNWVLVVELDDIVPRRDTEKPNLYVGITVEEPKIRFDALRKGKGPKWLQGHLVRLREDLTSGPFILREEARFEHRMAVTCLKSEGFTVNRDPAVWTVYVVELDPKGCKNPGKGFVYVGQTSKTPEERFEEHKKGRRNRRGPLFSPVVKNYGLNLRMDLAPGTKFFNRVSAEAAEKRWCRKLKDEGYRAAGGH
jgi:predicted GIY-YIG superfamily endonuclease